MKNKTNPIGVRFDISLLNEFKEKHKVTSAQKVLNILTLFFRKYQEDEEVVETEKVDTAKIFNTFIQDMDEVEDDDMAKSWREKVAANTELLSSQKNQLLSEATKRWFKKR